MLYEDLLSRSILNRSHFRAACFYAIMILSTIDIYAKAWSFVENMIDIWVINDKKQS